MFENWDVNLLILVSIGAFCIAGCKMFQAYRSAGHGSGGGRA